MQRREFLQRLAALLAMSACGGASEPVAAPVASGGPSNFHTIYGDPALRERFVLFLEHVFHLYPEDEFDELIAAQTARHGSDQAIYEALLAGLPTIKPVAGTLTHALPALKKQKLEMAVQAAAFLGDARVDGYIEVGSTGRYLGQLEQRVPVEGPIYVLNDISPTYGPVDLIERGQLAKVGEFLPIGDYDPVASSVPDQSIDLVSNLIGFHHCPVDRLEGFIGGIRRVLRPGGRLLLREHDVADPTMHTFVALAHDVFNAGVGLPWEENARQLRGFRSVADWTTTVEAAGFKRAKETRRQAGDPTDNAMLAFVKV